MRLDLPLLQHPLHEPTERGRKIVVLRVRREIPTLEPERLTKLYTLERLGGRNE